MVEIICGHVAIPLVISNVMNFEMLHNSVVLIQTQSILNTSFLDVEFKCKLGVDMPLTVGAES